MLRLRPYKKDDAETIMSWIKDEKAFYKWTAGILGEYPISVEQFNAVSNLMAFTAIDDNEIIGFFTMRRSNEFFEELRAFVLSNGSICEWINGKFLWFEIEITLTQEILDSILIIKITGGHTNESELTFKTLYVHVL